MELIDRDALCRAISNCSHSNTHDTVEELQAVWKCINEAPVIKLKGEKYMEDRCICCGAIVPEGRMVCPICEAETEDKEN